MKDIFQRYYKKYDAWYDKNRLAYLSELKAISRVLPKSGKGLEIGVGTGRFAAPLGIGIGVDPAKNMIALAWQRGVDAKLGYGEHLTFRNATFDYVTIIITICFVQDPQKVLEQANRVLKKNGKVIIGIIDKNSFLGKFYQNKRSVFYKQANFFSVREITDLLKATGFNKFSYYQTIFQVPDKINSAQEPQRGFGKGGFVIIRAQKSKPVKSRIYRKFNQYERIRFLFKRYGYDMEVARQRVLKRAGRINEPILDAGTGPGRMAYTLACNGYKLTTIYTSKQAQEVAKIYCRRYKVLKKIKFLNMDAQNMKFQNGSFATTISANLLHDVKHHKNVIQEMIRLTRPGGKIVISDLNKKGRALVSKVYRINKEVHKGKPISLEEIVPKALRKSGIKFKKYIDDHITTYVGIISANPS
ncbi:MAG: methyltransferase domain-containing protein [Candidatus Omnitrophota bacterium]|jgi:ubiquinone/menaquinone biosynthesis C-methylase UbiE